MGLLARPLECDSERKLTIVRGSLRNHNRGGVLIWDAGAVRPIFLLQTPTAGYNTWCLRGRVDSFGYLPVSLWRTKDCFFPRSLASAKGGGTRKTCRLLRGAPPLDSPCPDSRRNSVSL